MIITQNKHLSWWVGEKIKYAFIYSTWNAQSNITATKSSQFTTKIFVGGKKMILIYAFLQTFSQDIFTYSLTFFSHKRSENFPNFWCFLQRNVFLRMNRTTLFSCIQNKGKNRHKVHKNSVEWNTYRERKQYAGRPCI